MRWKSPVMLRGERFVDVIVQLDVFLGRLEGEDGHGFLEQFLEVHGNLLEVHLLGFELGEIEDVVDEMEEGFAAGADHADELQLLGVEAGVEQERGGADDAVHRRADFVAHAGEEVGLGLQARLGEFLRRL